MHLLILLSCLFLLSACSTPDYDRAGNRAEEFHRDFNDWDFDTIYRTADETLRQDQAHDDFVSMLNAARTSLGEEKSDRLLGKSVGFGLGGLHMTLTYETSFENGTAREEFRYVMHDGEALLMSYHVESAVLAGP